MRRLSVAVAVVSLVVTSAIATMGRMTMAQDATPAGVRPPGVQSRPRTNAAIARRWHEEVISTHDLTVLDEILAPNPAHDSATFADNPGPRGFSALS